MDSETRGLLRDSVREVVTGDPGSIVAALAELGWAEVVADDPAEAITLLFTEHGRALGRGRILDAVFLDALAAAGAGLTGAGLTGAGPVADTVLYSAAGPDLAAAPAAGAVAGILLGPVEPGSRVLVAARGPGGGPGLAALPAAAFTTTPLAGFDPDRGLVRARLTDPGALAVSTGPAVETAWARAVAAGRRALAAEVIGVSRAALALAVEHTTARRQFGQSIAAFQSVRHRLAEVHVSITAAETLLATAWTLAVEAGPAGGDGLAGDGTAAGAARAAYAQAGRTAAVVTRHTVQVCGAMGAAAEFDLHRFLGRAAVLSSLLGGAPATVAGIGADLLATGTAPRLTTV